MKITVFGAGYVGLVTAACFAEMGNDVVCVDIDAARISYLQEGECPIHEPDLPEMLAMHSKSQRLRFTTFEEEGVQHGQYLFIAVGTPQNEDGSADLQHVLTVAKSIGKYMNDFRIVVTKSTVPVGTAFRVEEMIKTQLNDAHRHVNFAVISNPEFLREGAAVSDFMNCDRIIIGTESKQAADMMLTLYAPFNRNQDRVILMDPHVVWSAARRR